MSITFGLLGAIATVNISLDPSELGKGIVGNDNYRGTGYILHSQMDVRERFDIRSDQSSAFVSVTYNKTDDQWHYLANNALVPFTPLNTDTLIASVDFGADTLELLGSDAEEVGGVNSGILDSNITIHVNQWDGKPNSGEFEVSGTYLTLAADAETTGEQTEYSVPGDFHDVTAVDDREGQGYILYSEQRLQRRFDTVPSYNDQHFIAVVYEDGQWHFDSNHKLLPFESSDTDRLVAAVDFSNDQIELLDGYSTVIKGIAAGYDYGNLTADANLYQNAFNDGEFQLGGNFFATSPANTAIQPASTLLSRTTLPDGALGSTSGKGWTCTGLFYHEGSFWAGNDGRTKEGDQTHEPSVIRMNIDGTKILEQIDIHALEKAAGLNWKIKTIQGVAADNDGNLWVASSTSDRLFKILRTPAGTDSYQYSIDTSVNFVLDEVNGVAFNAEVNSLVLYSTSNGYLREYSLATGEPVWKRKFYGGTDGDQLFYEESTGLLYLTSGVNGKPGRIKVFDFETGLKVGQTNTFDEVVAIEGVSIVDNTLYFLSDAFYHPDSDNPDDHFNQLIKYKLDPFVNGTLHETTRTVNDFWF
ncbi:MAG: hypothetical protein HWE20_09475 [Gammaproteobacteria bacterium]|nr:hypothetical protein [Gammaproteobacteria bacterium]